MQAQATKMLVVVVVVLELGSVELIGPCCVAAMADDGYGWLGMVMLNIAKPWQVVLDPKFKESPEDRNESLIF